VTVPTSFRRLAGVVLGAASLLLPATLSAQGTAQNPSYVPSAHELAKLTASGSYLAARHAGTERDAGAAAAYYRAALRNDPKNTELLERAFLYWPKATLKRRSGSPTRLSSSTRPTASPGWSSACMR
jgi:hypothetical protein